MLKTSQIAFKLILCGKITLKILFFSQNLPQILLYFWDWLTQVICPTWWIVAMHSKADCLTRRLAWIKLGEIAEQTCNKSNSWLGNFKSATMTKFTTSSLILAFFWDNSGNKISMTLWGVQTFIKIFITRIHSILICTLESRVKIFVFFPSSQTLRLWVLSQVETIITIALSIWFGTQKVCTWFCVVIFFKKPFM